MDTIVRWGKVECQFVRKYTVYRLSMDETLSGRVFCSIVLTLMKAGSSSARDSETEFRSCSPPFPEWNLNTLRCEALKWSDIYGGGWSLEGLSEDEDVLLYVVCGADGNYPAADSNTFYRCQNGTATLQTCSSQGYPFFDPVKEQCSNDKKCLTFECINKPNAKVGLKGELTPFFSYCIRYRMFQSVQNPPPYRTSNVLIPKVISRCYGKDIFNPNSRSCEPICLQPGLIPDTANCRKYFLCSPKDPVNVRFFKHTFTCPEGKAFHEKELRCVPEDLVASCKSPYPKPI